MHLDFVLDFKALTAPHPVFLFQSHDISVMAPDAPAASPRTALIERITKETSVQVSLSLDGGSLAHLPARPAFEDAAEVTVASPSPIPAQTIEHHASQSSPRQQIWVWTGIGFLDHMLHALAKHAGWSMRVRTRGDLTSTLKRVFSGFCYFATTAFKPANLQDPVFARRKMDTNFLPQLTTTIRPRTPFSPSALPWTKRSAPAPASHALGMPLHR